MKHNRRNFIANSAVALLLPAGLPTAAGSSQMEKMKNVFIHHVFFWLNHPDNESDRKKLMEGLAELSSVKTIRKFHIGQPAKTSRDVIDSSYSVSWFVQFDNDADQESYQTDPIHLKFVEDCKHLWKRVVVYDSVDAL